MFLSNRDRFVPVRCLAALLACLGAIAAQDPPVDPGLPAQLTELKKLVKNPKMEEDLRAYDMIEALLLNADKRNPKDLDKIAGAIGDVFKTGKVRAPDNLRLYDKAADALARMGERGAKPLRAAVTDQRFKDRDYAKLRAHLLVALGKTKDPGQAEFLLEQAMRSPDDEVLAAAGEALGNFGHIDLPKVRDIAKKLVGRLGEWNALATQIDKPDPNGGPIDLAPENARRTLRAVRGPWNTTLSTLTGASLSDPDEWARWLNKKRDWTPPGRKN